MVTTKLYTDLYADRTGLLDELRMARHVGDEVAESEIIASIHMIDVALENVHDLIERNTL
jgi:hypothetical protein